MPLSFSRAMKKVEEVQLGRLDQPLAEVGEVRREPMDEEPGFQDGDPGLDRVVIDAKVGGRGTQIAELAAPAGQQADNRPTGADCQFDEQSAPGSLLRFPVVTGTPAAIGGPVWPRFANGPVVTLPRLKPGARGHGAGLQNTSWG